MPRFFVMKENIEEKEIIIKGQELKHIKDVLRLGIGDEIIVGDSEGTDYKVSIAEVNDNYIRTSIISHEKSKAEPYTKISLFQSLVKGDRFEWAIQKAVEIGVSEIIPMQTAYCVVKINTDKKIQARLKRWNKIAKAAAKQSGRGIIPQVLEPMSYKEAIEKSSLMDMGIIAYEKEDSKTLKDSLKTFTGSNLGILVGPEGGFSKEEIKLASLKGIQTITLGPRIFRSETAGLVLASNILYELDEQA